MRATAMRALKTWIPALSLLGALTAGTATAYVLLSPSRTWNCPPDYTVDNTGLGSVADGDGGGTRVVNAITAATAWNGAGAGTLVKAHKGSTASFSLGDGIPMLKFSDPLAACTGSCLAATFTAYYSERQAGTGSYKIDDADIVTNSTGYSWSSQGEDPGGAGCSNEVYVEGVMVHEVGHGLGLGHSAVAGSTMSPSVAFCDNGPATVEADDKNAIVALYGTAPCTGCENYTEYLTAGTTDYQPCGTYYSAVAGTHRGYLRGPAGTDFDLFLWYWNGSSWVQVASATSVSSSEDISYSGAAGFYLWGVNGYSGSGTYHFWMKKP
jgi:hypothetical protein